MIKGVEVCLIVAASANNVIGKDGDLPWRRLVPEDMRIFRELTTGYPVIMGRKTWESIPPKFRPLPDRPNVVLTRQVDPPYEAEGASLVANYLRDALLGALELEGGNSRIFVIGGEGVYKSALDMGWVDTIFLTRINKDFEGDTFLPKNFPNESQWNHEEGETFESEKGGFTYTFFTIRR